MEDMNESAVSEELAVEECWELLDRNTVGRLAVDIAGWPDIFPINYVVDGDTIVFRSGAGTKLAGAVLNRHVAFEIDGYLAERTVSRWSVVVKGNAGEIESMLDRYRADDLPLFPVGSFGQAGLRPHRPDARDRAPVPGERRRRAGGLDRSIPPELLTSCQETSGGPSRALVASEALVKRSSSVTSRPNHSGG